jgi:peptidoglycan/xylan/chitin deacetylase (PgdA/CDA1 family)
MSLRKLIFDSMYRFGFLRFFPLKKGKVTVLCFHRVSPESSKGYPPMSPNVFEGIIKYLSKKTTFIDFNEIDFNKHQKHRVIITFDDAYKDFEEYALPILKKYNVPVTLNVIASCAETGLPHWTQRLNCLIEVFAEKREQPSVDGYEFNTLILNVNEEKIALEVYQVLKERKINEILEILENWRLSLGVGNEIYTRMLTWSELNNMTLNYDKLHFGNHSYNHLNLKYVTALDELNLEIDESRKLIEAKLNCTMDRFAFPNGEYNELSLSQVEQDNNQYIQLTEIWQTPQSNKTYYRIEPYFSALSENIFKIHGFHDKIKRR